MESLRLAGSSVAAAIPTAFTTASVTAAVTATPTAASVTAAIAIAAVALAATPITTASTSASLASTSPHSVRRRLHGIQLRAIKLEHFAVRGERRLRVLFQLPGRRMRRLQHLHLLE